MPVNVSPAPVVFYIFFGLGTLTLLIILLDPINSIFYGPFVIIDLILQIFVGCLLPKC